MKNSEYLQWGGVSAKSVSIWSLRFGLGTILMSIALSGTLGLIIFVGRMKRATHSNGVRARVLDIRNKNSEAISYIGTYIIPFLFQEYSSIYATISIGILLVVIYFIYINSSLILINPILNLRYSLYELDFRDSESIPNATTAKNGMIIIRERYLEEGDIILIRRIGQKLYFGVHDE